MLLRDLALLGRTGPECTASQPSARIHSLPAALTGGAIQSRVTADPSAEGVLCHSSAPWSGCCPDMQGTAHSQPGRRL